MDVNGLSNSIQKTLEDGENEEAGVIDLRIKEER